MERKIIYISKKKFCTLLLSISIILLFIMAPQLHIPTINEQTSVFVWQITPLLLMALALGTDAFSLSIAVGMKRLSSKDVMKISLTIGVFHMFMPLIGMILGHFLGKVLGNYAYYLGRTLIVLIGVNMIYQSLKEQENENQEIMMGLSLLILAFSVSLDALTVGFGLGTFGFSIPLVVGIFGFFGGIMTAVGLCFGRYLSGWIGEKSEIIGGLVLIALGMKMFF